jgi:hypothetical protein
LDPKPKFLVDAILLLRIDGTIGVSIMSNKGLDDAYLVSLEKIHLSIIAGRS